MATIEVNEEAAFKIFKKTQLHNTVIDREIVSCHINHEITDFQKKDIP